MQQIIHDFVLLFAVIDPIGTLLLFLAVTGGFSQKDRNRVALRAILYSGGVMLLFLVVGQANFLHHWLGDSGSAILIRVMGMILAALAVEIVIQGIAGLATAPATHL